jgi:hypothetical protein
LESEPETPSLPQAEDSEAWPQTYDESELAVEGDAASAETPAWLNALDEMDEAAFADASQGAETVVPTPAENAPDWLNAMVPGLDVDYTASEETAAEPMPAPSEIDVSGREFAWLSEVVAAETVEADRPRYVFSRPPAWMDRLTPLIQLDAAQDDAFPDWPTNEDDVPDWLR